MSTRDQILLGLNRPQYAPSSEVLVSSLVHAVRAPSPEAPFNHRYRFLNRDPNSSQATTGPATPQQLTSFAARLHEFEVRTNGSSEDLAVATVAAITGVASSKGTSLPASPMSENLALAQDLAGELGAKNPPNLGRALEQMFFMGAAPDDTDDTMASLWLRAAHARACHEPLLGAIDAAFGAVHPAGPFGLRDTAPAAAANMRGIFPDSPYSWLNTSWRRLMDERWADRLPTRVWTDWTTAVLRIGLAFGYLAEMRWYELIGRQILADEPTRSLPVLRGQELLPWPSSRLPVHSRNVKTEIRQSVNRGIAVLEVLDDELKFLEATDALTILESLRTDSKVRERMRGALGAAQPSAGKNTYETIVYALQQRGRGVSNDYYGFLRPHGNRYAVIAPGTEWIAVVASLACADSEETNVGEVARSLGCLGLQPELQELVRSLEAAGMARGSADADHGVRVRSAF